MGNRNRRWIHSAALFALLALVAVTGLALTAEDAGARTFNVDSFNDVVDANPGEGFCGTILNTCTLRAAIQEASTYSLFDDNNTVVLPAGTYTLTIDGPGENLGTTGDLDILLNSAADNLTITGAGSAVTFIDGSDLDRVFDWSAGAAGTIKISGVTIRNGNTNALLESGGGIRHTRGTLILSDVVIIGNEAGGEGGGLYIGSGVTALIADSVVSNNVSSGSGGGISNQGTLTLNRVTVSGNSATLNGATGGIFNNQVLTVTESLIDNNASGNGVLAGGIGAQGPVADIVNTTISRNTGDGVRVFAAATSSATLTNCTVVNNEGVGLFNWRNLAIQNTIVSGNTGGDCDPLNPLSSAGHNLFGDNSCASIAVGTDLVEVDPQLGPLQDNGGPTPTYALLPGSPAIDNGADVSGVTMIDQRGVLRPQDGDGDGTPAFDIGAFEKESSSPRRGGSGGCAAAPGGSSPAPVFWIGLVLAALRLTAWRSGRKSPGT